MTSSAQFNPSSLISNAFLSAVKSPAKLLTAALLAGIQTKAAAQHQPRVSLGQHSSPLRDSQNATAHLRGLSPKLPTESKEPRRLATDCSTSYVPDNGPTVAALLCATFETQVVGIIANDPDSQSHFYVLLNGPSLGYMDVESGEIQEYDLSSLVFPNDESIRDVDIGIELPGSQLVLTDGTDGYIVDFSSGEPEAILSFTFAPDPSRPTAGEVIDSAVSFVGADGNSYFVLEGGNSNESNIQLYQLPIDPDNFVPVNSFLLSEEVNGLQSHDGSLYILTSTAIREYSVNAGVLTSEGSVNVDDPQMFDVSDKGQWIVETGSVGGDIDVYPSRESFSNPNITAGDCTQGLTAYGFEVSTNDTLIVARGSSGLSVAQLPSLESDGDCLTGNQYSNPSSSADGVLMFGGGEYLAVFDDGTSNFQVAVFPAASLTELAAAATLAPTSAPVTPSPTLAPVPETPSPTLAPTLMPTFAPMDSSQTAAPIPILPPAATPAPTRTPAPAPAPTPKPTPTPTPTPVPKVLPSTPEPSVALEPTRFPLAPDETLSPTVSSEAPAAAEDFAADDDGGAGDDGLHLGYITLIALGGLGVLFCATKHVTKNMRANRSSDDARSGSSCCLSGICAIRNGGPTSSSFGGVARRGSADGPDMRSTAKTLGAPQPPQRVDTPLNRESATQPRKSLDSNSTSSHMGKQAFSFGPYYGGEGKEEYAYSNPS